MLLSSNKKIPFTILESAKRTVPSRFEKEIPLISHFILGCFIAAFAAGSTNQLVFFPRLVADKPLKRLPKVYYIIHIFA